MCGRYGFAETSEDLRRALRLTEPAAQPPERYNLAPTQPAPVVGQDQRGRRVGELRWGVALTREGRVPRTIFNLRAETVLKNGLWRSRLLKARLVAPASHFYEWVQRSGTRQKTPTLIRRRDGEPLCLAAIFAASDHEPGSHGFSLISTEAPPALAQLHSRWPVVLDPDALDVWFDPDTSLEALAELLLPPPASWFEYYAVRTAVNSVANDSPDLALPLVPDEQPHELVLHA